MMKECELCDSPARMYCESDQASLCWDCDSKVHSANFLVARHLRSLLCDLCQSPTPWKASGGKLGPTASVCERCVSWYNRKPMSGKSVGSDEDGGGEIGEDDDFDEESLSSGEDEDYEGDIEDDDDQDGENQVVPWTCTSPPPASSSMSSDESFDRFYCGNEDKFVTEMTFSSKRMREDADLDIQDDIGCSSIQPKNRAPSAEDTAITVAADEDFQTPKENANSPIRSSRLKIRRRSMDLSRNPC